MEMEVRDAAPEHIQIDDLGVRLLLQGRRDVCQRRAEGRGLVAIEILDVRDVASGFQIAEPEDLCREARGQSPQTVLPDLHPLKLHVALGAAAQEAVGRRGHRFRSFSRKTNWRP
jgi:hypothetical protein